MKLDIARWKNNAACAFVLYYDDGCESVLENVVPVLQKYNLPGTFYLSYGGLQNDSSERLNLWIEAAKNENIVIGNHTLTHRGAEDLEDATEEILRNDEILRKVNNLSKDALVSFAAPGGVPWNFSNEDIDSILKQCNSIPRIRWGDVDCVGGVSARNAEDFIKVIDLAEQNKDIGMMLFHGVGGDWISFPACEHLKGIQELVKLRDLGRVWCASAIDAYKYQCERETATLNIQESKGKSIIVNLEISTNPLQYDTPLTIVVRNDDICKGAIIKADNKEIYYSSNDNTIMFDIQPISQKIEILFS